MKGESSADPRHLGAGTLVAGMAAFVFLAPFLCGRGRRLEAALEEARGKLIMVVVGHPFYAAAPIWAATPCRSPPSMRTTRAPISPDKIGTNMTLPKLPFWWWTNRLDAWPFSVEWLSAAFDFNVAPFYQSFGDSRRTVSRTRACSSLRHRGTPAVAGSQHLGRSSAAGRRAW